MKKTSASPPATAALRRRRGWSQAEFARLLGVDSATVSRWERGGSKPRPAVRAAIASLAAAAAPALPSAPGAMPVPPPAARFSSDASIDELVRAVGLNRARLALRAVALQLRSPEPFPFPVDPTTRLRELDRMVEEQRAAITRARIR